MLGEKSDVAAVSELPAGVALVELNVVDAVPAVALAPALLARASSVLIGAGRGAGDLSTLAYVFSDISLSDIWTRED